MSASSFFQRQARARRLTAWLVVLFLIAVLLITFAVCVVAYLATSFNHQDADFIHWLTGRLGIVTALCAAGVISLGSLIRWIDLAGGGNRVAAMVNARLIDPSSREPDDIRLRNVTEEMAIASGVPVPQLYVMDRESGINAFVAGYSPNEAVLVVTHGALTKLSRSELQGVVAHEFSHILNGDMRLNVRLISLLAGILIIGKVGHFLLHSGTRLSTSRRSRNGTPLLLVGLGLAAVGYIGVICGRLIQAAVSRQREILADASAVQFTRNPEAIGGALFRISQEGSYFRHTFNASDLNHLCIGETVRIRWARLMASHPPIEDRIKLISPGLLALLRARSRTAQNVTATDAEATSEQPVSQSTGSAALSGFALEPMELPAKTLTKVGTSAGNKSPLPTYPSPTAFAGTTSASGESWAQQWLATLPGEFRERLYQRTGAIQFCYALIKGDWQESGGSFFDQVGPQVAVLIPDLPCIEWFQFIISQLGDEVRFPALELAVPALKKLDPEECRVFLEIAKRLIREDAKVTLFEYALYGYLKRHLGRQPTRAVRVRYRRYAEVSGALHTVMSLLARASSHDDPDESARLYQATMSGFAGATATSKTPAAKVTLNELTEALNQLRHLSPMLIPAVLESCSQCVLDDGRINAAEYDVLRLLSDQLDCPLPPLVADANTLDRPIPFVVSDVPVPASGD